MIPINRTFAPLQAFVDELVRCGLHHAVTSPGSRNAPLILTLAGHPSLDCVSVIDERSAGFVALGIAKSTRRPVAITCTSGTAAANLATKHAAASAVGLTGLFGYASTALSGIGVGVLVQHYGWDAGFLLFFCCGGIGVLLFAICWGASAHGYGDPSLAE